MPQSLNTHKIHKFCCTKLTPDQGNLQLNVWHYTLAYGEDEKVIKASAPKISRTTIGNYYVQSV
jgi:hypothetical protein